MDRGLWTSPSAGLISPLASCSMSGSFGPDDVSLREFTMRASRTPLLLAVFVLASCGGKSSSDGGGENFRTTFRYFHVTGNTAESNQNMPLMGESDITLIQNQTGTNQTAGLGFIAGRIDNGAGVGVAGVTVQAHNDSGLPAGSIFYQSAITFAYSTGLTMTTSTGRFVV